MTILELSKKLQEENIPLNMYNLSGGLPSEQHCISNKNASNVWEVYYSERGNKSNLKKFNAEEEACEYFFNWVYKTAKNMNLI